MQHLVRVIAYSNMTPQTPLKGPISGRRGISEYALRRMAKHEAITTSKGAATSAMRKGVTERPMEKDISKSISLKRTQAFKHGTSVYRLKKGIRDEETADTDETTSVSRLRINRLVLPKLPPIMQQKPPHDPYGDI